ncbi:SCP-like protein [Teladorsagia circumcincta]|uniref:SCP-like protein n=1 Tax=Teladorsagia circumcincta TaxID=45464 RepID=A0A2G9U4F1_TELCI|nr:SCP-like protein [Teladorsagia circumcincta]
MDWDCDLEQKAAQQIAQCTVPLPIDPSLAQNIARWLYYANSEEDKVLRQVPWSWVTPSLRFMKGTALDRFANQWAEPLANIANWKNRKVGCAYKICPALKNMVVSCVYGSQHHYAAALLRSYQFAKVIVEILMFFSIAITHVSLDLELRPQRDIRKILTKSRCHDEAYSS